MEIEILPMAKIYRFFRIVMPLIDFSCFLTRVASDTTLDLQLPCVHSSDFLVSMLKHFYQLGTRRWWLREFPFLWRTETRKRRRDHHKPFLSLPWENWNYFHKKEWKEGSAQYCEDEEEGVKLTLLQLRWHRLKNPKNHGKCSKKMAKKYKLNLDSKAKNEVAQQYGCRFAW